MNREMLLFLIVIMMIRQPQQHTATSQYFFAISTFWYTLYFVLSSMHRSYHQIINKKNSQEVIP
jgi:uncharacterized membrane protein